MVADIYGLGVPRPAKKNTKKKKNYKPTYLTEEQIQAKGIAIIEMLDTLPMGHALAVLDHTKELMLDCHTVDIQHPQFGFRYVESIWPYSEAIKAAKKQSRKKRFPYFGLSKFVERILKKLNGK